MRKDINRITEADFYEALTLLHYTKCRQDASEWRHFQFHLFIRKKGKDGVALTIHEDMPSSLPPFHRARHSGKALEQELAKIIDAYQKRRAARK